MILATIKTTEFLTLPLSQLTFGRLCIIL